MQAYISTRVESRKRRGIAITIATSIISFREFFGNVDGERSDRSMDIPGHAKGRPKPVFELRNSGDRINDRNGIPEIITKSHE